MFNEERVFIAIAIVVVLAFFGGIGWFIVKSCANGACSVDSSYNAPVEPQEKPVTKTRCDYTGVMASSIIAEEARNGYVFTGRVNTFFCENALSFYLRGQQ